MTNNYNNNILFYNLQMFIYIICCTMKNVILDIVIVKDIYIILY